jgi:hypothetical protein
VYAKGGDVEVGFVFDSAFDFISGTAAGSVRAHTSWLDTGLSAAYLSVGGDFDSAFEYLSDFSSDLRTCVWGWGF